MDGRYKTWRPYRTRLEKHGINYDYYTTNMNFQDIKFRIKGKFVTLPA